MRIDCDPRCIADVGAVLGEGPVWVERESALYWVDIKGNKIFRIGEGGELAQWDTPVRVGSLLPRAKGGFIGGTDRGIAHIDPQVGRYDIILTPEEDRPTNRFNDGKTDRQGRFWAGSMDDEEERSSGALYRFDTDGACSRIDDDYKVTNGPAFSPDGRTMYHNDSARQVTYAFDLDEGGNAANRRTFARYSEGDGYPDGMTVDSEGCLWIAFWDGWCVRRYSPEGECLATIDMPVQKPTSCAFGGAELDRLYVTSASIGLDEGERARQAEAGGLFMLAPGVKGLPEMPFAG